jgi:hypothetical protein
MGRALYQKKRKQEEDKEKESIKRNPQQLHCTIDCHPFFDNPSFSFFLQRLAQRSIMSSQQFSILLSRKLTLSKTFSTIA